MEQNNVLQLKKLGKKLTGKANVDGNTIAEVLSFIEANYSGGSGGGGATISNFILYQNEEEVIKSGEILLSDGTSIPLEFREPDELTLTSANGSAANMTVVTVAPMIESNNHYRIFIQSSTILRPAKYEDLSSWTAWDGTSEIEAQKGRQLAVAECNSANQLLKIGFVKVVSPLS